MKKLNLALIAIGCSSLANDLYLNKLSKFLRKLGHQVWLVHLNPSLQARKKFTSFDLSVYWPGPKHKWFWFFYLLCPTLRFKAISILVQKKLEPLKNKLTVVDWETTSLYFGWRTTKKQLTIVRGWYYPHHLWQRLKLMWPVSPPGLINKIIFMLEQFWYHWGEELAYRKADLIITLTPQLARQLIGLGFKAVWSPLAVTVNKLPKRTDKKKLTFGSVAYDWTNPRKGFSLLLNILTQLSTIKLTNSYQLQLIGSASQTLKKQVQALGLTKKIIFLGKQPHSQVLKIMKTWDGFVFPSLFEELSLATLESLAAGLPTVGWQIPALQAAYGKAALLVPKKDINRFAQAMAKLINNQNLRKKISHLSFKRANKYFCWPVVVKRLVKIYQRLASS